MLHPSAAPSWRGSPVGKALHDSFDISSARCGASTCCSSWCSASRFLAKVADHVPGLAGTGFETILKDVYEYLRDMSLLIATGGVAYITNVFQKRHGFVEALKEEWRDIIATKSALFAYTQLERPTLEQYIATFCKLSETIDNMRSVYRNVGETDDLVGLYPYAPLHDMRRALQTLDPRKTPQSRRRGAQPGARRHPAVVLRAARDLPGGVRPRAAGPSAADLGRAPRQEERLGRLGAPRARTGSAPARTARPSPDPRIDEMLAELYAKENATAKPWRQAVDRGRNATPNGRGA